MDDYLENYIIAETKEQYRINSVWHAWCYRGLLYADEIDARILGTWEIIE